MYIPGIAYFHILRRSSGGSFGNNGNFSLGSKAMNSSKSRVVSGSGIVLAGDRALTKISLAMMILDLLMTWRDLYRREAVVCCLIEEFNEELVRDWSLAFVVFEAVLSLAR
jgi:hypothetical protein